MGALLLKPNSQALTGGRAEGRLQPSLLPLTLSSERKSSVLHIFSESLHTLIFCKHQPASPHATGSYQRSTFLLP